MVGEKGYGAVSRRDWNEIELLWATCIGDIREPRHGIAM